MAHPISVLVPHPINRHKVIIIANVDGGGGAFEREGREMEGREMEEERFKHSHSVKINLPTQILPSPQ